MTIMTVAEFRGLTGGAGSVSDQAVALALDAAEERIALAHGAVGVNREAVWRALDGADDSLGLPRRATALVSVSVGGVALATTAYTLADGGLSVLNISGRRWYGDVVVVYAPEPFDAVRRQMQQHLAMRALGYTGLGAQSIGSVSVQPLAAPEADDARILRLMPQPMIIGDTLPDSDREV